MTVAGFPRARSQIAVYSVPLGFTAYVTHVNIDVNANKAADVIFFKRENILETAAPYTAMEALDEYTGITGEYDINYQEPLGPFPALTDMGFMAEAASATDISITFSIILEAPI